jgi:hypothetical protein
MEIFTPTRVGEGETCMKCANSSPISIGLLFC